MIYTPHTLQVKTVKPLDKDEFGRPIPGAGGESWVDVCKCRCDSLSDELSRGAFDELVNALSEAYSLISVENFTKLSAFSEERSKADSKSEVAGNNCLLGQIASFVENLHLSYREVVYEIPYRNLVIMQKDKLRVLYGGGRLQEIAKNATTNGEHTPIGELYGFPILVKTETSTSEGVETKQNRFFIEGAYKYSHNNGQLAMSDHKAAATSFLSALDRIPKQIEQFQKENAKLEQDLPTLREIVGGTWKKYDELKELKSEVATLERKIQLALAPPHVNDDKNFAKEHIIIARDKPPIQEASKGFKI